jgi:hypothetical protein
VTNVPGTLPADKFPVYVQDTAPASWMSKPVFLWHRVQETVLTSSGTYATYAACCHKIKNPEKFIYEEYTFADWDREFGDDVDLCQCAVTAPKDIERLTGFMEESIDEDPA